MSPSHVLFLAEGQLGDLLLLTPALRAFKKTYPSASISVLVVERHAMANRDSQSDAGSPPYFDKDKETAVTGNPNVEVVYTLDRKWLRTLTGLRRLRAELKIVRFLRSGRFDTVVCTFPEDRFVIWAWLSGAAVRVGQRDQALHRVLTHTPDIHKNNRGVLEYYCDLVNPLGVVVDSKETEYHVATAAIHRAEETLRRLGIERTKDLVAVHPGATGNYKIWPPENYAALIDHLQRRDDIQVLLCPGAMDRTIADAIQQHLRRPVATANAGNSVSELAAILQRSLLCISNDSGPRHLAVAVGTPTLAFFRQFHTSAWKIYPDGAACVTLVGEGLCPSCPKNSCLDRIPNGEIFGSYCLRMITPEMAIAQTERVIDGVRSLREEGKNTANVQGRYR